jgi:hypothetical protein
MEMPNSTDVPDPKLNDPNWKDVTNECQRLIDKLSLEVEGLFGPRTRKVPLRVKIIAAST